MYSVDIDTAACRAWKDRWKPLCPFLVIVLESSDTISCKAALLAVASLSLQVSTDN